MLLGMKDRKTGLTHTVKVAGLASLAYLLMLGVFGLATQVKLSQYFQDGDSKQHSSFKSNKAGDERFKDNGITETERSIRSVPDTSSSRLPLTQGFSPITLDPQSTPCQFRSPPALVHLS
jgi:hypothetical protein